MIHASFELNQLSRNWYWYCTDKYDADRKEESKDESGDARHDVDEDAGSRSEEGGLACWL